MSWEDTAIHTYRCPCGAGTFTVRHRSDDWGRYDEVWEMQCPHCQSGYVLHRDYRLPKGIKEHHFGWVPKPLWESYEETQMASREAESSLRDHFRQEYWSAFMARIDGMSRKAIWEALTSGGTGYPVLSTFYKHVRDDGVETVVGRYVNSREIRTLTGLLGRSDSRLDGLLQEALACTEAEEAKLAEVHRSAIRAVGPRID